MATIHLPPDFREFFQLLNSHKVLYLVIGGYAVAYHGYPRATGDIDIWIATNPDNAKKTVQAIKEFGFTDPDISEEAARASVGQSAHGSQCLGGRPRARQDLRVRSPRAEHGADWGYGEGRARRRVHPAGSAGVAGAAQPRDRARNR